jgi:prepilin-type processing-associated H-X9-DG protein
MAAGHYLGGTTEPEHPIPAHPDILDVVNPAVGAQIMSCPANLDPEQQIAYIGEGYCYGGFVRDPWYWGTNGYVWKLKGGNITWTSFPNYWPTQADRNILLLDSVRAISYSTVAWDQWWWADAESPGTAIDCRHAKRANCLFMDGHIEALSKAQLTSVDNTGSSQLYGGTFAAFYPLNVVESEN